MPCKKCDDNKYRWGAGNCQYKTLQECEAAHQTYEIVELVIDDDNEAIAIDAISLVTSPAIETPFVYFNDDEKGKLTLAKIDEEKRMLISPALIPYKQIYRYNAEQDKHYYVHFTAETVRKAAEAFIKHHNTNNATIQHEYKVTGVSVIETWISEDSKTDKSSLYGYELPKNTWFVSIRIDNDEVWQQIKSGELRGVSIEGYFVNAAEKMASVKPTEPTDEEILLALEEVIAQATPQRIDLSLFSKNIDGLKVFIKDVEGIIETGNFGLHEAERHAKEYGGIVKDIRLMKTDLKNWFSGSKKFIEDAEKKIKDLGVKPDSIPDYKEYKKLFNTVKGKETEVDALIKKAQKIRKMY